MSWSLEDDSPRVIGDWIRECALRHSDKVALEIIGREKTYRAIHMDSDRVAAGVSTLGLGPGTNVAVMMKNSLELVDVWFGLAKAGVVEVPVNHANRGDSLRYVLAQSNSQAVVCDDEFAPRIAQVLPDLPRLRHVIVHGHGAGADTLPCASRAHVAPLPSLYCDGPAPTPKLGPDAPAVILYTSGTTGPSKGVLLSHEANLNITRHSRWLLGYGPDDVLYTPLPLYHVNARYLSLMCAMEAGGRLAMDQRFSASRFWDICRSKGVTAFNYIGALLLMLWKQPPRDDDADNPVKKVFGSSCPVEIWEPFEKRFGVVLTEVYGTTEVCIATENRPGETKVGTVGRPSHLYEVRVVDEHDEPLPAGEAGEIVARPTKPNIAISEYYQMPEASAGAFRNFWFHTGDRGRFDDEGYLTFIDRIKDCVRRRGENISSYEVEAVINRHPAVLESAIIGVPSELGEEEVLAAVVVQPGASLTPVELLAFCAPRMAYFAVPRFIRWMEFLPKNASERVQKFHLRAEGKTPDTWDRETTGYQVQR